MERITVTLSMTRAMRGNRSQISRSGTLVDAAPISPCTSAGAPGLGKTWAMIDLAPPRIAPPALHDDPQVHPAQQIKLYPFQTKKDFRELVVGGVNTFGGSKNRKSGDNAILLNVEIERRTSQSRYASGLRQYAPRKPSLQSWGMSRGSTLAGPSTELIDSREGKILASTPNISGK